MTFFDTVQKAIEAAASGEAEIWVADKGLTGDDVRPLLEALKTNRTVTWLSLHNNALRDVGAALVGDMLRSNNSIQKLGLHGNQISDAGATALSEMLMTSPSLMTNNNIQVLYLQNNQISDAGATALLEMLEVNSSLAEIGLENNNITASLKSQVYAQVTANKALSPKQRAARQPHSKTEVGAALRDAGLGRYALAFFKDGVRTLADCQEMTEEEAGDVGVEAADIEAVMAVLYQAHLKTEVGVALLELGLPEYADMLWTRGNRSLDECSKLTGAQLKELGVNELTHRRQLLKRFAQKQKRQSLGKRLSQALLGRRGSAEPDAPEVTSFQYDVFLTHDWGEDELGRANHERASRMNAELKKLGLKTWFDEERLDGRIDQIMADGVQRSRVIAVFITQRYMRKVASRGHDNCEKEFGAATRMRTAGNMVPIVMEPRMRDTNAWTGPLQLNLGGTLFVDFSDDDKLAATAQELHDRVRGLIAKQAA